MTKLPVLLAAALCAAAPSLASAAVIWSDGTFTAPLSQPKFTVGTDPVGAYYTNTVGGSPAYLDSADGNPAPELRTSQYGSEIALALPAPANAETWTIAFDYRRSNTWGTPQFQVYALASGTADLNSNLYGGLMTVTDGQTLLNVDLPSSTSDWTAQSFDVAVPSGMSVVLWRIASDGSTDNVRLDNIQVTSAAVPEPASLGLLALGALGLLRRRH